MSSEWRSRCSNGARQVLVAQLVFRAEMCRAGKSERFQCKAHWHSVCFDQAGDHLKIDKLCPQLLFILCAMWAGCVGELGGDIDPEVPLDDAGQPIEDAAAEDTDILDASDAALDVNDEDTSPLPPTALDCASITGVVLCEDFESGTIRTNIWTKSTKNTANVDISGAQVKQGNHALRVTLPPVGGGQAYIAVQNVFPVAGNRLFGRVYFYATPDVVGVHNEALYAVGPLNYNGESGDAYYRLSAGGNANKFGSRYNHASITEHGGLKKGSHTIPINQWICIEWDYDGPNNRMKYWFNGVEEPTMTVTGTESPLWKAPTFQAFNLGFKTVQQGEQLMYVYYDALVLDTERVGCGAS